MEKNKSLAALAGVVFVVILGIFILYRPEEIVGEPKTGGPLITVTPTEFEVISTLPAPPTPAPLLEDPVEQIGFAILGGDWRDHREGTKYGNKTDVSLIVIVTLSDPVDILAIQLPRNLYVDTSLGDYWQFAVYKMFGPENYQKYIREVMGINVPIVAYIDMERYVPFVDEVLDGIVVPVGIASDISSDIGFVPMDGAESLSYLRDNDNNWMNCLYYDCEGRQFRVLKALAERVKTRFFENPLETAKAFWQYRSYFETNIHEFEQFHYLIEAAWNVATSDYSIRYERLTQSGAVEYGDTPLEVRGWIETGDIEKWVEEVLYAD